MHLFDQPGVAAFSRKPAFGRRLKRIKRDLQATRRNFNRRPFARLGFAQSRLASLHCHRMSRPRKELGVESYVCSQLRVNAVKGFVHGCRTVGPVNGRPLPPSR